MFSSKHTMRKGIMNKLIKAVYLNYLYCDNSDLKNGIFPSYFLDELNVEDVSRLEKKYMKMGLVIKNAKGQPVLTKKGILELKEIYDYVMFFSLAIPYIDIMEYENEKEHSKKNFHEVIKDSILKKIQETEDSGSYETAGNLHYEIGNLYYKTACPDIAIYHYIMSFYYQTSGYEYTEIIEQQKKGKLSSREADAAYEGIYIDPNIITSIKKVGDRYDDKIIDEIFNNHRLKVNLCTVGMFRNFVNDIIIGQFAIEKCWGSIHTKYNELIGVRKEL